MAADKKKTADIAAQIIKLASDDIMMRLRFLNSALSELSYEAREGAGCVFGTPDVFLYDPLYILKAYKDDERRPARILLHSLFHNVLMHAYASEEDEGELWNIAVDAVTEAVILELDIEAFSLREDEQLKKKLKVLKEDAGGLTPAKIYRHLKNNGVSSLTLDDYRKSFCRDDHSLWKKRESFEIDEQEWQKISERIRAELKAFSEGRNVGDALKENLDTALKEKYDYEAMLRRFMVMGEQTALNEEEFDYVYYTYGLKLYDNLPLIEPLEYREEKRIKDFVIALDTSASCSRELIESFLLKSYQILGSENSWFSKVNIHMIQCDAQIQSDRKVTSIEELKEYIRDFKIQGFGATDFRPVFSYVNELKERGEFDHLKGLIYFTDGYGIYPEKRPDMDVMFVFVGDDEMRRDVPAWSMKAVLDAEELKKNEE
ncbi:MAG: VWA-like domain-containing protein [Lachnospiraceae bacterium]|nr:VWA-like domain-containing protein [Lachnospiraceae bacterium]